MKMTKSSSGRSLQSALLVIARGALPAVVMVVLLGTASVAMASGGELDVGQALRKVLIHAINFAIFVAIVVYFGRRPIMDFLANRRLGISRELEESQRIKDEAEAKSTELQNRLRSFDREVQDMLDRVATECDTEKTHALEAADEAARGILQTSERTIREETDKARHDLRQEAVDAAVTLAEQVLTQSINDEDQRRLLGGYMDRIAEEP